jgi:hypothetical protein
MGVETTTTVLWLAGEKAAKQGEWQIWGGRFTLGD